MDIDSMRGRIGASPTDSPARLSIVIVSYENSDVLTDCLDSIFRHNDLDDALQVIVVEQSDSDKIYDLLISKYPGVTAIRNENNGFGSGNNRGVRAATAPYLLFLNPDTILVEPVFKYAVDKFDSDSRLGLFGVRLITRSGQRNLSYYFHDPSHLYCGPCWRVLDRFSFYLPRMMYITGADMFVRASVFKEVGGFAESLFLYFEESVLCKRVEKMGFKVRFFGDKRIIHLEGQSIPDERKFSYFLQSYKTQRTLLGKDPQKGFERLLRKFQIKLLFHRNDDVVAEQLKLIDEAVSNLRISTDVN